MSFPDKIKKINQKYDMMASIKQFIQLEDMLISNKFILIFLCSLLKQLSLSLYHTFGDIFGDCFGDCLGDFDLQKPTEISKRWASRHRIWSKFSPEIHTISSLEMLWLRPGSLDGSVLRCRKPLSSLKDVMGISRQLYQSEYEMNHIDIYCVLVMSAKKTWNNWRNYRRKFK